MTAGLIAPHGGTLVTRTGERPQGVDQLERITLSQREVADLDMLASGALSPLRGFMGRADYESVVERMHLADGTIWAWGDNSYGQCAQPALFEPAPVAGTNWGKPR